MVEFASRRRPAFWALFAGLAVLWLFVRLLPLSTLPPAVPGPDLLVCLVFAWVLRRPEYMPVALITIVVLIEDFLILRPPGLWALMVVLGSEFLRRRQALMREFSFPAEWVIVAVVLLCMLIGQRALLALTMVPQPPLGQALLQVLVTLAAYPLVVAVSHLLFRVRKPATGAVDELGRPL